MNHCMEQRIEELDQLVWRLLDDRITSSEFARLEHLLTESEGLRKHYILCMQLHADLHTMFDQAKHRAHEDAAPRQPAAEETSDAAIAPPLIIDLPLPGSQQPS